MPEVLVTPDPVNVTRAWLDGKYPWPVTVTKNRPTNMPTRLVLVRRTGGVGRNHQVIDPAWLNVECYAATDLDASNLAHLTWGLLFAMAGQRISDAQVYRVSSIAAPNDFPLAGEGELQRPRYVMTVQVQLRAAPV